MRRESSRRTLWRPDKMNVYLDRVRMGVVVVGTEYVVG